MATPRVGTPSVTRRCEAFVRYIANGEFIKRTTTQTCSRTRCTRTDPQARLIRSRVSPVRRQHPGWESTQAPQATPRQRRTPVCTGGKTKTARAREKKRTTILAAFLKRPPITKSLACAMWAYEHRPRASEAPRRLPKTFEPPSRMPYQGYKTP